MTAEIGQVGAFFVIPSGWLYLNGQAVLQRRYRELARVVPRIWLQSDVIILPNLAGKTLLGAGDTLVYGVYVAGDEGGEYRHVLEPVEIPNHFHYTTLPTGTVNPASGTPGLPNIDITGSAPFGSGGITGGDGHNNVPPYIVVYWCIYAGR